MKLSLVGFSLLSTLAGATESFYYYYTKEDCLESLEEGDDEIREFMNGIEDANPEDIQRLCSDIGRDFFSYSGDITCDNGEHEEIDIEEDQFMCLPTTCTDDKELLDYLIVGLHVILAGGSDPSQCFGSIEYEGLGDGIPQPMQCNLDLKEVSDEVWTNFGDAIMDDTMEAYENDNCGEYPAPEPETEPITCGAGQKQCSGHYGPGGDGNELLDEGLKWCCASCDCKDLNDRISNGPQSEAGQKQCSGHYGPGGDGNELLDEGLKWCCASCNCKDLGDATTNIKYTNAARVCEENDGMDFFTYSRSTTLIDGTIQVVADVPTCLPSSCTSDEEILKAVLLEGSEIPSDEHSFVFTDIGPNDPIDNGPAICMDPPKQVKFQVKFKTSKMKRKNCVWARKNAKKRCNFPEIEEGCPMTCGGCDSTEKFLLNNHGVRKSCKWAKRKKTSQRCSKSPTSEMCPSVCESWPSLE
uniref:ShKT domain-containing protein n=1 Tax=Chaetoceros debilis TaxID=122233 RepID=A0A7S3PVR7_9STRA